MALFYGHRIGRPQATAFRYYPGLQRPSEDGTVREKTVNIPTADGQMETFVVHPEESGPFAPVIIYMDVWGLRPELCDIARKVAVVGYYVLLPDLYYRQGRIRNEWRDADGRVISLHKLDSARQAEVLAPARHLSNATVVADSAALLDFIGRAPRSGGLDRLLYGRSVRHPLRRSLSRAFPRQRMPARSATRHRPRGFTAPSGTTAAW